MDWSQVFSGIWGFMNSAQGIIISVTVLLYLRGVIYAKKPLWKKYEGYLIQGIKAAEKTIDDNTKNASLAKLDCALRLAISWIEEAEGRKITNIKEIADIKNGISVVHADLESIGGVKSNDVVV